MPEKPTASGEGEAAPVIRIAAPIDEIARLLRWLQGALMRHPVAAREVMRLLAAEGRSFAETAEGRAWRQRLESSPVVREARTLWEGVTFPLAVVGGHEGPGGGMLPGMLLDDVFTAAAATAGGGVEAALARAFVGAESEVSLTPVVGEEPGGTPAIDAGAAPAPLPSAPASGEPA